MSPLLELIERIEALVSNCVDPAQIKPHLASLSEHIEGLEQEIKDLKSKNAGLEGEASNFYADVETNPGKEDFVEHRGAFFKRKPEGGYHLAVYCPRCHESTGSLHEEMPCVCSACDWYSGFSSGQLASILKELPQ